jgi:integrase
LQRRGVSANSCVEYLQIWRRVASRLFVDERPLPPPENFAHRVSNYLHDLLLENKSGTTIRNHLIACRYFYRANGHETLLDSVRPPLRVRKDLTRAVLDAEVTALFAALEQHAKAAVGPYRVLLLTGMRLSELVDLAFTLDDLRAQRLLVRTATGEKRVVYIGKQAAALLVELRRKRKLPKGETGRLYLNRCLRETVVRAGLPDVTPSRLRMTYACRMIQAGFDLEFVAKNLGLNPASKESRKRLKEVYLDYLERSAADG